jgi:Fe-S-cluster-containing dehydrogenase component/CRP-like cAMP-binding protein
MRFNYDDVDWQFVGRILDENSIRLSRTRGGKSNTGTSPQKQPLALQGDALKLRTAENERRVQQFLFQSRKDPPPGDGKAVLALLWQIADLTNDGLLPAAEKLRSWPSQPEPPAPARSRVEPDKLASALEQFAEEVYRRWTELEGDPVPLASWAEWELNGGTLHPFYDGCGRISRAFGGLLLLRASWMLPLYEDRDAYFTHGHGGPKGFAGYVRNRIAACSRWVTRENGLEPLPLTWQDIERELQGLEGFRPQQVKRYFQEDTAAKSAVFGWRLFFKIQYRRGQVILRKGDYSDYAALHLRGLVRVSHETPAPTSLEEEHRDTLDERATRAGAAGAVKPVEEECWIAPRPWQRKLGRFLSGWLSRGASSKDPAGTREAPRATPEFPEDQPVPGKPISPWADATSDPPARRPVADRLMGITGAVWHQPRSVTLRADNDGDQPCEMLLIKRKVLEEILAPKQGNPPSRTYGPLYRTKVRDYLRSTFPDVLRKNRLFRSLFYVEDCLDWPSLLSGLRGRRPDNLKIERIRQLLDDRFQLWLMAPERGQLDDPAKYRIASELNELLKRDDLHTPKAWPLELMEAEERTLLAAGPGGRTANERCRLNRLLIEAAFPNELRSIRTFCPNTPDEFRAFAEKLVDECDRAGIVLEPKRFQKRGAAGDWAGESLVYGRDTPVDGLYLILGGKFAVTKPHEDNALLNHLGVDGFFGESCVEADENSLRQARVEVLSNSGHVLKIDRRVVHKLCEAYPAFRERLKNEVERNKRRDAGRQSGLRPPPKELHQAAASRLVLTTNLLMIDMERCTRCDQCVQACGDAHQDRPRFHRANPGNPDLRFGKWEVAAACLHCSDAPCLEECPVGAITFLERGAVEIHRDRCIGCGNCPPACPFGVIDMYPPAEHVPGDGRSLGKKPHVATKCDLCLTRDRQPPCVVACPYGAAVRGRPEVFFPDIKGWAFWAEPDGP